MFKEQVAKLNKPRCQFQSKTISRSTIFPAWVFSVNIFLCRLWFSGLLFVSELQWLWTRWVGCLCIGVPLAMRAQKSVLRTKQRKSAARLPSCLSSGGRATEQHGGTKQRSAVSASTTEPQCLYKTPWVIRLWLWQGHSKLWKVAALLLTCPWKPLGKRERCSPPHWFFAAEFALWQQWPYFYANPCSHGIFGILCYLKGLYSRQFDKSISFQSVFQMLSFFFFESLKPSKQIREPCQHLSSCCQVIDSTRSCLRPQSRRSPPW